MNKTIKSILVIFVCCCAVNSNAQKTIDTIATKAGGYDIPIRIKLPKKNNGKRPVYFFIHGGGWNGGDTNKVPPARLHSDANFLADELGIIYVGLAYRCKGNNATYADAISDLEASVKWFMDHAERFNADVTRIGFGGASAGSTLSASMAQKYTNCKVYIGAEGMYNLVDHTEERSPFPNQKAREIYGLTTKKKSKEASAFYNLKKKPPASLLFHGKEDRLCHYTQSEKFAKEIIKSSGKAKVILYDKINHTCFSAGHPDVLKNSVIEIAKLFIKEFDLEVKDISSIENLLKKRLKGQYPSKNITKEKLFGIWKHKNETLHVLENGKGFSVHNRTKKKRDFQYSLTNESFKIVLPNNKTRLYILRNSNNAIYYINIENNNAKYRRINYIKQK